VRIGLTLVYQVGDQEPGKPGLIVDRLASGWSAAGFLANQHVHRIISMH